ncbi:DUF2927 domain-containing protein [Thermoleptolyngbya sp. C42_A2020_037]|uniref:DUF2927 domain-containing protein n=1 Tax=Thermoleptolyngbya sp. C42_A2020_037 TaxID=2747799 RepID=UPI001A0D2383|nr:DUF2927 domain-containing protein [Thermoleptolyngbya sp. C42_A2020_037]MBF2084952.1 DUF2927 domain-containing protein [Thermoleptolyngbya sp. C42_A2020_037]
MNIPFPLSLAALSLVALGVTQALGSQGHTPSVEPGTHLLSSTATVASGRSGMLSARDPQALINIRVSPGVQSRLVFTGTPNTPVMILQEAPGGDGFTWYQVRLGNGVEGWVRGDLVRVTAGSGAIASSPAAPQPPAQQAAGFQNAAADAPIYDPSSGALMRPGTRPEASAPNRGDLPSPTSNLPAYNPSVQPVPPASVPTNGQTNLPRYSREVVVDQQGQRDITQGTANPAVNQPLPSPQPPDPPGLVDRIVGGISAIGNRVGAILNPGPAPLAITQADIDYFTEVALGSEWGNNAPLIRRWNTNLRIRVTGTRTAEDDATIRQVMQELNELLNGSGVQLVRDDRNPNVEIIYAPESQFRQLEPNYVPGNLGFFWVRWNNSVINYARILITNTNRVTQRERSHLLREELTQVLGLMRDSNRYPNSIFYQGWTDVTEYAEIDRTLIRMLYHPQLRPGMTQSQAVAVLQTLVDPRAARTR